MAPLRKRYQARVESSDKDGPPVAAMPQESAARPPESVDALEPVEQPTAAESDPVAQAEKSALRQRLAEMERAATTQQAMTQRQQQFATEPQRPQQAIPEVPGPVRAWLAEHPEYLSDVVGQAELQLATLRAVRDGKKWGDDDFLAALEGHLGLAPAHSRQQNGHTETSTPPAVPASRNRTPVQQQHTAPVSAPPTRAAISMSTGRPTNEPVRLTAAQVEIARSLGITEEEYAAQQRRMVAMKRAGVIQDAG
jgi:hypothetical protein